MMRFQLFSKSPFSRLWIGLMALMLLSFATQAEELRAAHEGFFDETFGDMQEELATVEDEGKKALLIMFETDDCPWCMRMKENVLNRVTVQDYFKENFRIVTINAGGGAPLVDFEGNDTSETQFSLKLLRVRATPVFAFYDSKGELLTKYTGVTKNAADFMLLGEFVVDGHFKDQRFSKFRRERNKKPTEVTG